ncbi:hypothetical protein GCM10022200_24000 [Microbacterium awajiense]|uniref:Uncharacterized protein n=1 Tax=Microbacterium awajiense TaxID=415214 RepID=A0ABP7AU87_9MICO
MASFSLRARAPRSPVSIRTEAAGPSPISVRDLIGPRRKVLMLDRLTCVRKNDLIGRDEIRLEIWADGQFDDALRMKLGKGRHKNLGTAVEFDRNVRVVLFDEDISQPSDIVRIDRDDELGSHGFTAVGDQMRAFRRNGAHYVLAARVVEGDPGGATTAWELADDFEASTDAGRWPRLSKARIVAQLRDRLAQPWLVDQGPTNTCGPAAVVFELIRRSPRRYVRLVRSLFKDADFTMKDGSRITTSMRLRAAPARTETEDGRTRTVPDVDWLVLAALRESANVVYAGPRAFDRGGSTHWEVAGWLYKLNGYNRVRYFPGPPRLIAGALTPADVSAPSWLDRARDVLDKNGAAIASVDSSVLGTDPPDWWSKPEHLVAVLDRPQPRDGDPWPTEVAPLELDRSTVRWSVFTWGGIAREQTMRRHFESGMWMLITAY